MRKIETKKLAAAVTALALCAGVLTGCGGAASGTASSTAASSASSEASSEEADEMAAKNVADLIDAIYVQERNDDTDAQCEAAKAAWDALTDTQKELVDVYKRQHKNNPSFRGTLCSTPGTALRFQDRKSTRLNSSHVKRSRMPSSA